MIAKVSNIDQPSPCDPVTGRYEAKADPSDRDAQNLARIRLLMRLFGLSISEIARAGNVSRPYLSRALSGSLLPNPAFYRNLEQNLGRLIEERNAQFFSIPATPCDQIVQEVLNKTSKARAAYEQLQGT